MDAIPLLEQWERVSEKQKVISTAVRRGLLIMPVGIVRHYRRGPDQGYTITFFGTEQPVIKAWTLVTEKRIDYFAALEWSCGQWVFVRVDSADYNDVFLFEMQVGYYFRVSLATERGIYERQLPWPTIS